MHRLFIGLRPPPTVRERLRTVMHGVPDARWQDDDQLHLTLRFVGEVDGRTADDLAALLALLHAQPVTARLAGTGTFEQRGRVTTLWSGVAPREPLAALHRKVDRLVVQAGLEPERRAYLPHVTLARMRLSPAAVAGFLADHAALSSEPFEMRHVLLFESTLGQAGARYTLVERYPLSGCAAP